MKCSVMGLALGLLALPGSAWAQEGKVSFYGTLHPFADNYRTSGATPEGPSPATGSATQVILDDYTGEDLPNRFRITSGTSNLGFRGEVKLGEHISAFFQVENAVNPDGDHPVLTSPWASRNSGVGLKGDYGTLFYGNWDTPYKYPTLFIGPLRGLNPFDNVLTGTPGFNVPGTTTQNGRASARADAAFNRRQGNSIQYWSPKFVGLSFRLAVSLNEGRTRDTEIDPSISPTIWSGLLSFDHGPFAARYAYERHIDYFGTNWVGGSPGATFTNRGSNDDAHEFLAWYEAPTRTRLAVVAERLTYRTKDTVVGAVKSYQRDAIYGSLRQSVGDHALWGAFGVAARGRCVRTGNLPCRTNGLGAKQWSVGYTFSPIDSVDIFASYYEMINNKSSAYGLIPAVVPVAPGVNIHGFGLGILYTFDVTLGITMGKDHEPAAAPVEQPKAAAPAAEPPPAPAPEPKTDAEPPAAEPAKPAAP